MGLALGMAFKCTKIVKTKSQKLLISMFVEVTREKLLDGGLFAHPSWIGLMENVLKPLAKSVLIPLGLKAAASATDPAIRKKFFGSGVTTLIIKWWNKISWKLVSRQTNLVY